MKQAFGFGHWIRSLENRLCLRWKSIITFASNCLFLALESLPTRQEEKGPLGKICYLFKAKEQQQTSYDANNSPVLEFYIRKRKCFFEKLLLVLKFWWVWQARKEKLASMAKPDARPGKHSNSNLGWNRVRRTEVLHGADIIWLPINQQTH